MNNSRIYGYARVSTTGQREDRQINALLENGVEERYIFVDKQSGKDMNRPQLQLLLKVLRPGDVIFITSLDRISRSYSDIKKFFQYLQESQVDIVVIDMPLLDTRQYKDLLGTFISDLILSILSYVAEQERTFIKKRQREGIDNALKNGTKTKRPFGRPKIEKPSNFDEVVLLWKNNKIKTKEAMELLNLKPNTFYNLVKKP